MRGPDTALGYFDDPEATASVFDADGWGRMGDLGLLDGDGYLHLAGRVKEIIEHTVGSSLIYLNSNAADFKNPEMRGLLDQYLRGSDGYTAVDRAKVMKLLWDALGSEFGGRHELYERNYAGNAEDTRRMVLSSALASGDAKRFKGLAEQCMSEYDLDGWTIPGFFNPDDISLWGKC